MRTSIELLRRERRARVFLAAATQSSLGTGAAYVALLIVAYERFHSPWAVSLVLLVDFLPSMFLGPVLGAVVDRWSRRWCTVIADVLRAAAFVAIAFVGSFEATLVLAFAAGVGTALFRPAALSALPTLVAPERLPSATSLYTAIADLGFTLGPALAALALLFASAKDILLVNGLTFAISALVLARLPFGSSPELEEGESGSHPTLFQETRDGLKATAGMRDIRVVIAASAGALFAGGLFNVAELLFAREDLGAGPSGYSALVALFGLGFVLGSLQGGSGGAGSSLNRRYLQGLLLAAVGLLTSGLAPSLMVAAVTFTLAGLGNGLMVVHERLLIQSTVDERLQGRVFAVSDALVSWGFAIAFTTAGGLISLIGTRELILVAGGCGLIVYAFAALALRGHWQEAAFAPTLRLRGRTDVLRNTRPGEHGAHASDGGEHWLALLDDLSQDVDDRGVELSPGVST